MRFSHIVFITIFFLVYVNALSSLNQVAQIVSISNSIADSQGNQYSSLAGGTIMYIKGSGFETVLSKNLVTIGNVQVAVIDRTNAYLTILTPPMSQEGNYNLTLAIQQITNKVAKCLCDCRIFYRLSFTPEFLQVTPRSGSIGDIITLSGYPKTNLASNIQIQLGNINCDKLDQGSNGQSLYTGNYYSFTCQIPSNVVADYYRAVITIKPQGSALNQPSFTSVTLWNKPFEFECVPSIDFLNTNYGSPNGQKITIHGRGFSSNSNTTVQVGNLPCDIISVSNAVIQCQVSSDIIPDVVSFNIKTRGLKRMVYDGSGIHSNLLSLTNEIFENSYWNNNFTSSLLTSSLEVSFIHLSNDYQNFVEVYHGYFKAPFDGPYTFYLTADGYSELLFSSTSNSSDPANLQKIITYTPAINGLPYQYNILSSQQLNLVKNQYYLIEAFRSVGTTAGNIKVGVELPQTQSNFKEAIQFIRISYTPTREQFELKIYNWKTGIFKILVEGRDPVTGDVVYHKETQGLDYNITVSNLTSILNSQLGWGYPSIKRIPVNKTGDIINDTALLNTTAGFLLQINLTIFRDSYQGTLFPPKALILTSDTTPKISFLQTQAPTPYITGTYSLKFGDLLFEDIPSNLTDLFDYLKQIPGYNRYITCELFGSINEDRTYVIKFIGMQAPVPLFELIAPALQGGDPNSPPQVTIGSIRDASTNAYYSAIPDDLLYQYDSNPQVNVYVNNIISKCSNDNNCSYIVSSSKTPMVMEYNITSSGLSILLSNYKNYEITSNTVNISFALSNCQINTIQLPIITCNLPLNSNGTFKLAAGKYKPLVDINNIGVAIFADTVVDSSIDLKLTSISLTKGSIMGGQNITITGTGFPPTTHGVTASIGLSSATVVANLNGTIVIKTLVKTQNNNIVLTFNNVIGTNNDYQYDETITPVINSISPNSSSPVQKAELRIQGTGFGSDAEKVRVFLDRVNNSAISYELSVVSLINGEILAILGGGRAGLYNVRVDIDSIGSAKPVSAGINSFVYDLAILSINPKNGSIMGGTLLDITGINFSPVLNQNQVFIGDDVNQFCDIVFSNNTNIQCITRPAPDSYDEINETLVVAQRVQEESRCAADDCNFTYTIDLTPEITFSSTDDQIFNVIKGDVITFSGSKLMNDLAVGFVNFLTNGVIQYTVNTSTLQDDGLSFIIPAMVDGNYCISIEIPNKGFASFANNVVINNMLLISKVSLNKGLTVTSNGSKGGVLLMIDGNGFLETDIIYIQTNVGNCLKLNDYSPTSIVCKTKLLPAEGTNYSVYLVRNSSYKISCDNCGFKVSAASTIIASTHNMTNTTNNSTFIINIKGTNLNQTNPPLVTLDLFDDVHLIRRYQGIVQNYNYTNVLVNFIDVPAGSYLLSIYYDTIGYVSLASTLQYININHLQISPSSSNYQVGYFGGPNLTLSSLAVSFPPWNDKSYYKNTNITICGFLCEVITSVENSLTCKIPRLKTQNTLDQYKNKKIDIINNFHVSGDTLSNIAFVNDGDLTTYYDSNNNYCFITFDFGADFLVKLENIQFFLNNRKTLPNYYGLVFQYSLDGVNYTNLSIISPSNLISGLNIFKIPSNIPAIRSIKFYSPVSKHVSRCNLAEIEFQGTQFYKNSSNSITSQICDVKVSSYGTQFVLTQLVSYSQSLTPQVFSISPEVATTLGGSTLTINGLNFGTDKTLIKVILDGVQCVISSANGSYITCLTGARSHVLNTNPSIEVTVNGNRALLNDTVRFIYADRWSDPDTWGGESPPRAGDSVYIPAGQNILLDNSTELLNAFIIEGGLIFNDQDIMLDANYLVCVAGRIEIGTINNPFTHKAVITMHGDIKDKQLPIYGNKLWALQDSFLGINGLPRSILKTVLRASASVGDASIQVVDYPLDWVIDEEIVIASTDYQHDHAEVRKIVSINQDIITLDQPLKFNHYSSVDQYGKFNFPMQAEVALLTRNIVFQGALESISDDYGSHLYVDGENSTVQITYTEFRNVGQANILDRYPINLHNIQDASDSLLIGNSIHNSFSRAINLKKVNNLLIKDNLAYLISGCSFVMETGSEVNNILDNNLGISSKQAWTIMNIDILPATFYISNPGNAIINNRAAGSDWVGFQLDFDVMSDSDPYICPMGSQLIEFSNNIAHSNAKFGLYIFRYQPRENPCAPANSPTKDDWFIDNRGIKAVFSGFISFSNKDNGVLAEYLGNVEFNNFFIADSYIAGIQISDTQMTYIDGMKVSGCLIIGYSLNINNNYEIHNNAMGLITPRTDNLYVSNVTFFNFTATCHMRALLSCSKCNTWDLSITGGKSTKFDLLSFNNVDQRISWGGYGKEVYIDLDGSLSGAPNNMITTYYPHLDGIKECLIANSTIYDNSIICNSSVQIRTLMFRSLVGSIAFTGLDLKVYRIPALNFNVSDRSLVNSSYFTVDVMKSVPYDTPYTWDLPFVTGYMYNIHWHNGNLDFTHMNLLPSLYWLVVDKGIVLKFNCSDYKDDYYIRTMEFNGIQTNVSKLQSSIFNPNVNGFSLGDYAFNSSDNELILGVNGAKNGSIEINTIRIAPIINDTINFTNGSNNYTPIWDGIRYWSNASLWPKHYIPLDGEDVWIEPDWYMIVDIDTANLGTLTIDGYMTFESNNILRLQAERIWVRDGKVEAGNATNPYIDSIEITLLGGKSSDDLVIDSFINSGNKILAITGEMNLYGLFPYQTSTRLASLAAIGASTIDLVDPIDWIIGSEIAIGSTESNSSHFEKKIITSISNGGRTLGLNTPLDYFHYGSSQTTYISDDGVILDMRAAVGSLTRNIKIKGDRVEDWGCNVMVYQYSDEYNGRVRRGNINFEGVEISYCGQSDTERGSLDVKYVKKGALSSMKGSTIHDGYGWGLYALSSNSFVFENNIIFDCQKFLAKLAYANNFSFSKNLLIAARDRNLNSGSNIYDMVAGFDMEIAVSTSSSFIIDSNVVQSSEGNGFVLPGFNCNDKLNSFTSNQASSITYAGLLLLSNNSQCLEIRNLSISSSYYGVLSNFDTQGIYLSSMIIAETIEGTSLMYSHEGLDNKMIYNNIVFMAIARSDCSLCYVLGAGCSNSSAVILPIVTISGKGRSLPINSNTPYGLTGLYDDAAFDQRLYLRNAKFYNYKLNYTLETDYASCQVNRIFKMRSSAPDASASVYVRNSSLINSESASFFSLSEPSTSFLGAEGGCGDFLCTGEKNWLFTDEDGLFLGNKSQVIPKNNGITAVRCSVTNPSWNGEVCTGHAFGILQFQNNGADQRTRPIAPVNLTSIHMENVLNQWKEWLWQGTTPMNRRLSRFHGLIELNVSVDVGFVVTVPEQMKFRLETNDPNDFVLLNIVYERSNVIEVWNAVTSTFIQPFRVNTTNLMNNASVCGANIYDNTLNKISFILTGDNNCVLTVRTINAVKVNMRMETTLDDFYKNNGEATFFDKISTFLGIDFSRIRIANIRAGSVIVEFFIVEVKTFDQGTDSSDSININPNDTLNQEQSYLNNVITEFSNLIEKLSNGTSNSSGNNSLGLPWKILNMSTQSVVNNPNNLTLNANGTNYSNPINWAINTTNTSNSINTINAASNEEDKNNLELTILLAVIIPSIFIIFLIGCCCVKIADGASLFRLMLNYIFNKKKVRADSPVYMDKLQNVKINQILPEQDLDYDNSPGVSHHDSQQSHPTDEKIPIQLTAIITPSNYHSGTPKEPSVFHKDQLLYSPE